MKIVKQSVELFGKYDWNQIKYHIANAGGTCYAKPKETPEEISAFLRKLCKMGHLSVLEHCNVSFKIITSRSMLAQISRHRHLSLSVQSQRYCNYGKESFGNEITFIKPEGQSPFFIELWATAMKKCEDTYFRLLMTGASPQDAREVLPNSTATTMILTGNLRALYEYLKLRLGNGTQKPHMELAEAIKMILSNYLPEIFTQL